jgi:DNA-binding CsgD family transcriptional regulator
VSASTTQAALGRESPFVPSVKSLTRRDLEGALELVHSAASANGPEPFPPPVLEALTRLVPSGFVSYFEWDLTARRRPLARVQVPFFTTPSEVDRATFHYCSTYPLSILRLSGATRPCRLSDFLSARALHRLDYYDAVLRPLGVEHQVRLWLAAPSGSSRVFYFNRSPTERDFDGRECAVLQLLRPFLVAIRDRFDFRETSARTSVGELTDREAEVLEWVACGKTNQEIAALLVVSAHTVRKHLENIYEKLGVHTRTAAAARFLGGRR